MLDEVQTILVVDDHPLMRKGILQLIAMEPSLRLVGEAGDGQQGVELAHRLRPDLILLDLNMRGLSGMEALKALKAADLDTRVIILTVSDSEEDVVAALRLGADGYLLKDMEPEEVLHSLKAAAPRAGQRGPVARNLAAVLGAGARAADVALDQRDGKPRIPSPQRECRPQPRIAAADDRDIRLRLAGQRRAGGHLALCRQCLGKPPGGVGGGGRHDPSRAASTRGGDIGSA